MAAQVTQSQINAVSDEIIKELAPPTPVTPEHRRSLKIPESLYNELDLLRSKAKVSFPALLRALHDSHFENARDLAQYRADEPTEIVQDDLDDSAPE